MKKHSITMDTAGCIFADYTSTSASSNKVAKLASSIPSSCSSEVKLLSPLRILVVEPEADLKLKL
jgi:hypothetical protein